jgi:hypothetical protein
VNNCNAEDTTEYLDDTNDDVRSNYNSSTPSLTFTQEQPKALLDLLQQTSHAATHITVNNNS